MAKEEIKFSTNVEKYEHEKAITSLKSAQILLFILGSYYIFAGYQDAYNSIYEESDLVFFIEGGIGLLFILCSVTSYFYSFAGIIAGFSIYWLIHILSVIGTGNIYILIDGILWKIIITALLLRCILTHKNVKTKNTSSETLIDDIELD